MIKLNLNLKRRENNMNSTWDEIKNKAKAQTDESFITQVSGLTHLTNDEIKAITPTAIDREKLVTLLGIIADDTKSNNEKAEAIRNINGLAEIAVPLITRLL